MKATWKPPSCTWNESTVSFHCSTLRLNRWFEVLKESVFFRRSRAVVMNACHVWLFSSPTKISHFNSSPLKASVFPPDWLPLTNRCFEQQVGGALRYPLSLNLHASKSRSNQAFRAELRPELLCTNVSTLTKFNMILMLKKMLHA